MFIEVGNIQINLDHVKTVHPSWSKDPDAQLLLTLRETKAQYSDDGIDIGGLSLIRYTIRKHRDEQYRYRGVAELR